MLCCLENNRWCDNTACFGCPLWSVQYSLQPLPTWTTSSETAYGCSRHACALRPQPRARHAFLIVGGHMYGVKKTNSVLLTRLIEWPVFVKYWPALCGSSIFCDNAPQSCCSEQKLGGWRHVSAAFDCSHWCKWITELCNAVGFCAEDIWWKSWPFAELESDSLDLARTKQGRAVGVPPKYGQIHSWNIKIWHYLQ